MCVNYLKMVQTKKIVQPSRVPIINSYVNKVDQMVNRSVLLKRNCATANVIAKMVRTRKKRVVSIAAVFEAVKLEYSKHWLFIAP